MILQTIIDYFSSNILWIVGLAQAVILFLIWWVTRKGTKATKQLAKLEEDRKMWEVQSIIAPLNSHVIKDKVTSGNVIRVGYFQIGIKNIGRGMATVTGFDCTYDNPIPQYQNLFTIPFYLGVNEEFIWADITDNTDRKKTFKFDPGKLCWKCKYSDMHGNFYQTSFIRGELKSERILK